MSSGPKLTKIFTCRKRAFKTTTGEFWNTLWVQIEVIAQTVGNTITKPRSGCNSDQTISDYYKVNVLFTFVDHVVQEIDSRFSPRWQ